MHASVSAVCLTVRWSGVAQRVGWATRTTAGAHSVHLVVDRRVVVVESTGDGGGAFGSGSGLINRFSASVSSKGRY